MLCCLETERCCVHEKHVMCRRRRSLNSPKKYCFVVVLLFVCSEVVEGNVEVSSNSNQNETELGEKVIAIQSFHATSSSTQNLFPVQGVELCTCDLTFNLCDLNCCCDKDCSTDDKKQFSACEDHLAALDENLCERPYVVVNGTVLERGISKSSSVFCIWKDNYEERYFLPDIKGATTLEEFEELITGVSSLSAISNQDDVLDTKQQLDLIYVNSSIKSVLGVPYPLVGSRCNSYLPVRFSQNEEFECFQVVQMSVECASEFSPLSALTYFYGMSIPSAAEHAIAVEKCTEDRKNCTCVEELPGPSYNDTDHFCRNVVASVEYVVVHNGTMGKNNNILKVTVRIILHDVYVEQANQFSWVKQKFKITFEWGDSKNKVQLSGNPGYVVGYPVLAGNVLDKIVNFVNSQWLTVYLSDLSSECIELNPTPVLFGENVVSSCSVTVTGDSLHNTCSKLKQVLAMVLNNTPTHIAAYGNASRNKTGDWVSVLREDPVNYFQRSNLVSQDNKCSGVVRAISIELTYVYIGFADNRQAKIIGALLQTRSNDVRPAISSFSKITSWSLSTDVTISITFTDVTIPPTAIFAPFPTFDIRLPNDFFNPFV